MEKVNFYSLKWGDKYGPEFVNRVYGSLVTHFKAPFEYTIITDNTDGIDPRIKVIDLDGFDFFQHRPKDRIWTREKGSMFKHFQKGRNLWLDLDILIHDDITKYVMTDYDKPVLIWNHWYPPEVSYKWYGKGGSCHVNSSFVMWQDDNGMEVFNYLEKFEDEAFYTYKSWDKFLFYQGHRKDMLSYWPNDFVGNYTVDNFMLKGKVSIFNTSHLARNNITDKLAFELEESEEWVQKIWKSYSNV